MILSEKREGKRGETGFLLGPCKRERINVQGRKYKLAGNAAPALSSDLFFHASDTPPPSKFVPLSNLNQREGEKKKEKNSDIHNLHMRKARRGEPLLRSVVATLCCGCMRRCACVCVCATLLPLPVPLCALSPLFGVEKGPHRVFSVRGSSSTRSARALCLSVSLSFSTSPSSPPSSVLLHKC